MRHQNNLLLASLDGIHDFWIGGHDFYKEGSWIWTDSLKPVLDFVWHPGQPDEGTKANCLMLNYGNKAARDAPCGSPFYPLCHIKIVT